MRKKPSPKAVEWEEVDLANQLGPFCPVGELRAVLRKYPAPGNPDYAYFEGILEGRDPKYASKPKNIPGKLALLNFRCTLAVDPCRTAHAIGCRDGLMIQLGFFD